ncbi:hypothetical protein GOV04_02000 [Candidatus Woesearchaeota archaeon]|nr:hypothetical protein [Candidatus Woesearchaeota archaeon]
MAFSKSFPRNIEGSNYPRWEEIFLTDDEEKKIEEVAHETNLELLKECVSDAKKIISDKGLKDFQSDMITLVLALFEKRASHVVYWKENRCKEKFDELFNKQ